MGAAGLSGYRLNAVMTQLTVIATFSFRSPSSLASSDRTSDSSSGTSRTGVLRLGLGLGIEVIAPLLLLGYFKRRH